MRTNKYIFSCEDCYDRTFLDNIVLNKLFILFEKYTNCRCPCYLNYLENTCGAFLLNDDLGQGLFP